MTLWQRCKNIWAWGAIEPTLATPNTINGIEVGTQKAEFIMPNRVAEVLAKKPLADIDDVLV